MKKYKYVVVVGCSFSASSPTLVKFDETYGAVIAEHFGAKCYNLSKMGGSLQRINRKTLEWCCKNTDKFEDTLIIVGMTNINRIEIWNNKFCNKSYWSGPGWFNDPSYFQSPQSLLHKEPDRLTVPWSEEERKNYFINFYNDNAQIIIANIIISIGSIYYLYCLFLLCNCKNLFKLIRGITTEEYASNVVDVIILYIFYTLSTFPSCNTLSGESAPLYYHFSVREVLYEPFNLI